MNPKIVYGIFFVLLLAFPVFAQTVSPNVDVTVDLGGDSAVASPAAPGQPPSGNWWDLKGIQNWAAGLFKPLLASPIAKESSTVVPPLRMEFPNNGISYEKKLDLLLKLPQGVPAPKTDGEYVAKIWLDEGTEISVPFKAGETEHLETITVPSSRPYGEPVRVSVDILDSANQTIADTKGVALVPWQNPDFSNRFLELPGDFGSYGEEKQKEEFAFVVDRWKPNIFNLSELPAGKKFFAVSFQLPLELAPIIVPVFRGMPTFDEIKAAGGSEQAWKKKEIPFDYFLYARIRTNAVNSLPLVVNVPIQIENGVIVQNSVLDEPLQQIQLSKGRLWGAIATQLFKIGDPISKAIQYVDSNPEKPVMISYEFTLYGVEKNGSKETKEKETSQNSVIWSYTAGPFELKRALHLEEPEQPTIPTPGTEPEKPVLELEDEQGRRITEIVRLEKGKTNVAFFCFSNLGEYLEGIPQDLKFSLWANWNWPITASFTVADSSCIPANNALLSLALSDLGMERIEIELSPEKPDEKFNAEQLSWFFPVKKLEEPAPPVQPLEFGRILDKNGKEITGQPVSPQEIQVELKNIDPARRLYVFSTPAENPKNCSDLGFLIMKNFFETVLTDPNAAVFLDSAFMEKEFTEQGRAKAIQLFSEFAEKPVKGEPNFIISSLYPGTGTTKTWGYFGGRNSLATASGKEIKNNPGTWKIKALENISAQDKELLEGKSYVFVACQFSSNEPPTGSFAVPFTEAKKQVWFGTKKETLLDWLARIDQKVVMQLFGQTASLEKKPVIKAGLLFFGDSLSTNDLERLKPLFEKGFSTAVNGEVQVDITVLNGSSFPGNEKHDFDSVRIKYPFLQSGDEKIVWYHSHENELDADLAELFSSLKSSRKEFDVLVFLTEADIFGSGYFVSNPDSDGISLRGENILIETTTIYWENGDGYSRVKWPDEELVKTFSHEMGHFMRLDHACASCITDLEKIPSVKTDCCMICQWNKDIMSYCPERTTKSKFEECTFGLIKKDFIPAFEKGVFPAEKLRHCDIEKQNS